MRRLMLACVVLLPAFLHAQLKLQIDGRDGSCSSLVRPGETLVGTVSTQGTYGVVLLVGEGQLKVIQALQSPTYQFSVQIPADIIAGLYGLSVMGCRYPGQCSHMDSDSVTIDVEPVWPASSDGSHAVTDAPGVNVEAGGAPVMHRPAIQYPGEIFQKGIGGAAVVEVTPNWKGHVEGVEYLSGPEELRKDVIKAMVMWHFDPKAGKKPRTVRITFDPKEAAQSTAPASATQTDSLGLQASRVVLEQFAHAQPPYTLKSITVLALSEDVRNAVLAQVPVHPGQAMSAEALEGTVTGIRIVDDDLVTWLRPVQPAQDQLVITVTPPGFQVQKAEPSNGLLPSSRITPKRIRISPAAQAARLISKMDPVYPPLAKAAHIQGVVRFSAIIGNDGRVMHIVLLKRHPLLVQAAEDAARQWTYAQTLVNGIPVEVATEIEVEFFLPN